jgi:hypothetical protein
VESDGTVDVRPRLAARIAAAGWPLYAVTPVETSLEQTFLRLVAASPGAA